MLLMPLGGLIKNPNKGNPLGQHRRGARACAWSATTAARSAPATRSPARWRRSSRPSPAATGSPTPPRCSSASARSRWRSSSPATGQEDFGYGDYVAYSKICTHAGCPVSLYEQETSRILCPCHQSQFDVTEGAKPVFGPATRSLPQLPITVDDEGYFVARGDYPEAVGPTYWNRERI